MEKSKRHVTIIDEFLDNEQANVNRRLYDEQERSIQRDNIELNNRVKNFERQLQVLKHDPRDGERDSIKRALAKQAKDYQRLLAKKDEQIEGLNEKIQQYSQSNHLQMALRQANLEKLHLEKRLLSSSSSLNSSAAAAGGGSVTTTTHVAPTSTTTSTTTIDDPVYSSRLSTPSESTHQQSWQKTNEVLRADIQRLTQTNEDYAAKVKVQAQQLETKDHQENVLLESTRRENEELKQKLQAIETELLTLKSTQSHRQDLQVNIERLQTEIDHGIKERETTSTLNTQLRQEINNLTSINERISDDCEKLRTALIAKSDQFDTMKRDYEQLQRKYADLESTMRSWRDTNDFQRRLNEENEMNKQELKRKQDDFEQFQKMHDTTKRENQITIHHLQDKINDLERKTELQSLKHEEILQRFESLKKRSDRILPSSNAHSRQSLPISMEASFPPMDDSAPIRDRSAKIVVAKYSYEPLKFSPNDHPEIELPLQLGQHYLVYGEIDEDGFYDGRNLEGRYGLIPSNFIELVTNPNDLPENTKHLIQKLTAPRQRELTTSVESDVFINHTPTTLPKLRSTPSDISTDEFSYNKHVPCPVNLRIEKTFSNSVLIAWNPPPSSQTPILGYQVLFDHALYNSISAQERTRALIENINFNEKTHRISVRTVTQQGLSHDQQCTLLLTNSKDLADQPMDLRVDRITATTAVVSWWPASNQLTHKLYVNDVEVQTIKPGTYRFKLSGLSPNTLHKVMIKANPSTVTTPQQQLTALIDFRTISDESIQPPRRVQVTPGQQSNTLLVAWERPSSSNAIRGYRLYIDGHTVQDVSNPLNDQTVLNLNTAHSGRYLTIRTLTDNGVESNDSTPVALDDILKKSSRRSSSITPDLSTSLINRKETSQLSNRSLIETPSLASSMSTDVLEIDLRGSSPRNRTPTNENLTFNRSISSDEQRSISNTPIKPMSSQSPSTTKPSSPPLRSFIALFDYDPEAMSPNEDIEEELPFKKGQIIKVYGDQDADGFYLGRTDDGRTGYVPSNMVSEMTETDRKSPVSPSKRTPIESKKTSPRFESAPKKTPPDESSSHSGDTPHIPKEEPSSGEKNSKETDAPIEENKEPSPPSVTEPIPVAPTEPEKTSFFDRLKSTFTWNPNEPI